MSEEIRITGRLVAAARALAGVGQKDFANAAGISQDRLCRIECGGSAWVGSLDEIEALHRGLRHFGVIVIEECGDMGAGVRLKFTREDVRDMARLEGEGGIIGSDDAP